jgi:hypothetical protein
MAHAQPHRTCTQTSCITVDANRPGEVAAAAGLAPVVPAAAAARLAAQELAGAAVEDAAGDVAAPGLDEAEAGAAPGDAVPAARRRTHQCRGNITGPRHTQHDIKHKTYAHSNGRWVASSCTHATTRGAAGDGVGTGTPAAAARFAAHDDAGAAAEGDVVLPVAPAHPTQTNPETGADTDTDTYIYTMKARVNREGRGGMHRHAGEQLPADGDAAVATAGLGNTPPPALGAAGEVEPAVPASRVGRRSIHT